MKKPLGSTSKALWPVGGVLVGCFCAGQALAGGMDAPSEAERARYEAACAFLVDEVARLDTIVGKTIARDALVREDPDSGAMLFRHRDTGLRIEYVVTAGGKVLVSRAELTPAYFGKRLSARSLQYSLGLPHALARTFKTGCDRLYLTVRTNGPQIAAMTIEVDVD